LGAAALALAGCASLERAADDVRNLATHQPEDATYPDLADIPEKPARPVSAAEHNATVGSLRADGDALTADAAALSDVAAAMPPLPPPPKEPKQSPPRRGR
jgi:hypothetical protein